VKRPAADSRVGITHVPLVLIARYLEDSSEDAFQWFMEGKRTVTLEIPCNWRAFNFAREIIAVFL